MKTDLQYDKTKPWLKKKSYTNLVSILLWKFCNDKAVTALYWTMLKSKNIFKAKASQWNFILENMNVMGHQTWKARANLFVQPDPQLYCPYAH